MRCTYIDIYIYVLLFLYTLIPIPPPSLIPSYTAQPSLTTNLPPDILLLLRLPLLHKRLVSPLRHPQRLLQLYHQRLLHLPNQHPHRILHLYLGRPFLAVFFLVQLRQRLLLHQLRLPRSHQLPRLGRGPRPSWLVHCHCDRWRDDGLVH